MPTAVTQHGGTGPHTFNTMPTYCCHIPSVDLSKILAIAFAMLRFFCFCILAVDVLECS